MNINVNNYEEYLSCYVDGELDSAETRELMAFLEQHPSLEGALQQLESTKLDPEEKIVFPFKASLYHEADTKQPRLKRFYGIRWAAAAAVILLLAGIYFFRMRRSPVSENRPMPAYVMHKTPDAPGNVVPAPAISEKKSGPVPAHSQPAAVKPPKSLAAAAPVKPSPSNRSAGTSSVTPAPTPEPSPATIPIPELPEVKALPAVSGSVALTEASAALGEKPGRLAVRGPASEEVADQVGGRLASVTEKMAAGKKNLDQSITKGLSGLQAKTEDLMGHLEKKEIRIGRFTIAFNNE